MHRSHNVLRRVAPCMHGLLDSTLAGGAARLTFQPFNHNATLPLCTSASVVLADYHSHGKRQHLTSLLNFKSSPYSSGTFEKGQFVVDDGPSESDQQPISDASDSGPGGDSDTKRALFNAAMQHVPEYGWTKDAVRAGASDLSLTPAAANMFPGDVDFVAYFVRHCNEKLFEELNSQAEDFQKKRMKDRIHTAVKKRLQMVLPHIDTWPQALSILTQPQNSATGLALLAELVDGIWYAAGDKATDYSWYTKRALLAGIYSTTELYMLTDYSPEYADTWEALDRRIGDVLELGKAAGQVQKTASSTVAGMAAAMQQVFTSMTQPKS